MAAPPSFPLLLFTTTISCGGEGEQGGRKQSSHAEQPCRAGSEMAINNLAVRWHAMCCWMRMQSTRSTGPPSPTSTSPPSPPHHSISLPSLPLSPSHHNEEGECITMQQSQYTRHGSNGRCCGGCGEREQQKRRGSTTSHLLTHVPLVACVCMCGMQVEEDLSCW